MDLSPGLMKKDPFVSLNILIRFSIIFCSVMSLVSYIYQLNPSPLNMKYGSSSQVSVYTAVILELSASVLDIFISLYYFLLRSFLILDFM